MSPCQSLKNANKSQIHYAHDRNFQIFIQKLKGIFFSFKISKNRIEKKRKISQNTSFHLNCSMPLLALEGTKIQNAMQNGGGGIRGISLCFISANRNQNETDDIET